MSILIIGLTLALAFLLGRQWRRLRQRIVNIWISRFGSLAREYAWTRGTLGALLMVAIPVIVVGGIQFLLAQQDQYLAWFVFSLFVMVFAWGPRGLDQDVAHYLEAESDQTRAILAEPLIFSYRNPDHDGGTAGVIKGVFYQGLVRWFGVVFWFMVLGAAGALMFRLSHALLCESRNRALLSERQAATAQWLVGLLDFLPAVLMTGALAIMGDFDAVIGAWRRHSEEREGSFWEWDYELLPEVGYRAVMTGDSVEGAFSHDYHGSLAKVSQAMSLVWRSLICWLTLIALLIIAGVTT